MSNNVNHFNDVERWFDNADGHDQRGIDSEYGYL